MRAWFLNEHLALTSPRRHASTQCEPPISFSLFWRFGVLAVNPLSHVRAAEGFADACREFVTIKKTSRLRQVEHSR